MYNHYHHVLITIWKSFSANVTSIQDILSIFNHRNKMKCNIKYNRFAHTVLTRKGYSIKMSIVCMTNKGVTLQIKRYV